MIDPAGKEILPWAGWFRERDFSGPDSLDVGIKTMSAERLLDCRGLKLPGLIPTRCPRR